MTDRIRSTNVRFNLDKEIPAQAWQYLQTMDRQEFKSYSQVIAAALVDYFDRYYKSREDPIWKLGAGRTVCTADRLCGGEVYGKSTSSLSGRLHGRAVKVNAAVPPAESPATDPDADVDWDFLGE
ncbi:MAG: adenylate cyclase [Coprococcus phoceensis]